MADRPRAPWLQFADLVRCLRSERIPLRGRPMIDLTSELPNPGDAIRWLGEITAGGVARHALFCHPVSSATYRIQARPGDRLVADCALLPELWERNRGGVEFSVSVTTAEEPHAVRTITIDPGRRFADRRWRRLTVPISLREPGEIAIVLSTRVPAGAAGDHAAAIWGEPAIERRRPTGDVVELLRRASRVPWRGGVRAALRALRAECARDQHTASYRRWAERHALDGAALGRISEEAARLPYQPLISVITPVYNTDPRWLRACIESVRAQVYTNWELCLCDDGSTSEATRAVLREQTDPRIHVTFLDRNVRISAASNAALATARGEFIALLDHDDELTPDGLYEVVRHLNVSPDADVIYSDEDKRDEDGGLSEPFFKPDWSPEHLLSAMYTCHLTVARKVLVERVGGFRVGYEGAQDHDLTLRLSEITSRIHHLPKVLYHWRRTPESTASAGSAKPWADDSGRRALEDYVRRNALDAEVVSGGVPGLYRVKFAIRDEPLVTIVVVAEEERRDAIEACMNRVRERTTYRRIELLAASAGRSSLTRHVNSTVASCHGAHLVFLDAALDPADGEWLSALLEYSQQEAIGAVGGKIQYADGRLRHIGLVLGVDGGVAPAFHGHSGDSYGHFSSAIGVRNYAAVSGECLMTRRALFDRLGGFDERMPWSGADVDYCLRVRQEAHRVVYTPYAQLTVHRGTPARSPSHAQAIGPLREKWKVALDTDPYYDVNLSRQSADYRFSE